MKVREILDSKPLVAEPEEWAASAWERMQLAGADHVVVLHDGQLAGILSLSDLRGPSGGARRRMGRRVADLMRRDVVRATSAMDVRTASRLMRRHRIGCLPVVERGRLVGIVTASRLLSLLEQRLADA